MVCNQIIFMITFLFALSTINAMKKTSTSRNVFTSISAGSEKLPESKEERESEEVDCDDGKTIYSQYLKRFIPTAYEYKIVTMLIHFGSYAVESMHYAFRNVQAKEMKTLYSEAGNKQREKLGLECFRPNIQVPSLLRRKGRTYHSTTAEVFAAMYSNYILITSTLSLKACHIYYKEEGSDVADECQRLSEYLLWFQCIYPFREIYKSRPISNPKTPNSAYNSQQIVFKLIDIGGRLEDILNQDFTYVLKQSKPELVETFGKNDSEHRTIVGTDLHLLYMNTWRALLKPIQEDIIILHDYFNDAMNINYFLRTVDELIGLPYSREGITDVWKELAQDTRKIAGENALHLVFHILRTSEVGRMATIMEAHDDKNFASRTSLYSLTNVDIRQGIADFVVTL